jgi:HAD superfamily hydrolase (TIGR01450 family)
VSVLASFRDWLERHRPGLEALVLDVDGVLMVGARAVAGAAALLERLQALALPYRVLTNDANHSAQEKAALLARAGLAVPARAITSSGHGLVEAAARAGLAGELCFVLGRLGEPSYAELAGIRVTGRLAELPDCRAALVGEDAYDWEATINGVVNFLIARPEAPLVVPNPDLYYPGEDRRVHVAAGGVAGLIASVCAAYGRLLEPLYLGKPHEPIFHHNHGRLESALGRPVVRRRVLMVGDSLAADVAGARAFGYRSALVLTGATTGERWRVSESRPDLVFRTL